MKARADGPPIDVQTRHGSDIEERAKHALLEIVRANDVRRFLFTKTVLIESLGIPHSHPVLTLNTRLFERSDLYLSQFLHEQMHWFLDLHPQKVKAALIELTALFPHLPFQPPDGAADRFSSYLHLIVNDLEYRALESIVGKPSAEDALRFFAADHYRAIYRAVIEDTATIEMVLVRHSLDISKVAA